MDLGFLRWTGTDQTTRGHSHKKILVIVKGSEASLSVWFATGNWRLWTNEFRASRVLTPLSMHGIMKHTPHKLPSHHWLSSCPETGGTCSHLDLLRTIYCCQLSLPSTVQWSKQYQVQCPILSHTGPVYELQTHVWEFRVVGMVSTLEVGALFALCFAVASHEIRTGSWQEASYSFMSHMRLIDINRHRHYH